MQRTNYGATVSNEDDVIEARVFAELISYIEERVESGSSIFKITEVRSLYESRLKDFMVEKQMT